MDVRDLKWEVLKQTADDKYCIWRRVQVSYYDMSFHTFVTDDMFNEQEFLAEHLLECQRYVLQQIRYRLEHIQKYEMKNLFLH